MRCPRFVLAAVLLAGALGAIATGAAGGSKSPGRSNQLLRAPAFPLGVSAPLRTLTRPKASAFPRHLTAATIGGVNVDGIKASQANEWYMDGSSAVGPSNIVQVKAGYMKICSKTGTCGAPVSVASLFQNPPFMVNQCYSQLTTGVGSPEAQAAYDSLADRWVVVAPSTATDYPGVCFAVSTSGDPNGTYYRTFFLMPNYANGGRPGSPALGVWPDAYYASFGGAVDPFNLSSGITTVFAFPRAQLLTGGFADAQGFALSDPYITPTNLTGPTAPPAGAPNQFFALNVHYVPDPATANQVMPVTNGVNARAFHVDWANPANSNVNTVTFLSYGGDEDLPCGDDNDDNCLDEPNGGQLGTGILFGGYLPPPINYRNLGGYQSILLARTRNIAAEAAPIRGAVAWREVRFNGSTPFFYQSGTYSPDANSRFAGAMAMNKKGDIALGYNVTSTTVYPSIRITGRLSSDAAGTMTQGETNVITSATAVTDPHLSAVYWGPQTMAIDPDGCTFWLFGNYVLNSDWATRIASFTLPSCNMAQGRPATASSTENGTLPASNAVDGNTGTRWSSAFSDPQWIRVDLGSTTTFKKVVLRWEAAYARSFKIQTSIDGAAWTDVYSTTTGTGGTQTLNITGTGRYVRMYGTQRATAYGYSLYELEIYGS